MSEHIRNDSRDDSLNLYNLHTLRRMHILPLILIFNHLKLSLCRVSFPGSFITPRGPSWECGSLGWDTVEALLSREAKGLTEEKTKHGSCPHPPNATRNPSGCPGGPTDRAQLFTLCVWVPPSLGPLQDLGSCHSSVGLWWPV